MSNWTTGICQVNELNIHYLRTGGDKPPVYTFLFNASGIAGLLVIYKRVNVNR